MNKHISLSINDGSIPLQTFAEIVEQLHEGIMALDAQHVIIYANAAAKSLLGITEAQMRLPLVDAIRLPELHALVAKTTSSAPQTGEFRPGLHEDAPWLLVRVSVHPNNETVVLVFHDVTEIHRLEAIRRDFVANVSHELRTPISVVLANTETLLDGAIDDASAAKQFLDALHRNAQRLSTLLSDLLEISQIDAGKRELHIDNVELAPVVDQVISAIGNNIARKQLIVENETPSACVRADSRALRQILANLIENAVKYTPDGGTITVRSAHHGNSEVVEVCDSGPGIEPAFRERVFERFFRVDAGRSREMGGTGLGLSIAKNLTESMDGSIWVDSSPKGGSRFAFRLPCATLATDSKENAVEDSNPPVIASLQRNEGESHSKQSTAATPQQMFTDERVQHIRKRLLLMAGRIEQMVRQAVRALVTADPRLAQEIVTSDSVTNRDEVEIDHMCLDLLNAADKKESELRFVILVLKVVVDLERIGDLAVNISERAVDLATEGREHPFTDIRYMADRVYVMIRDALDAFVAHDADKARSVIERDDEVDGLYVKVFRRVLRMMEQDPSSIHMGIHIQSVAKWLERMADHGTNVAEQVIFMVEGTDVRHPGKLPAAVEANKNSN